MIDPDYLLWEPHEALTHREPGAPNQTFLRRAVSNFYYALFHELCRDIANQHIGFAHRKQPRYTLLYRALEHGRARQAFEKVSKDAVASIEARTIASAFLVLQQARHTADYDPSERFYVSDVLSLFLEAEAAIGTLRAGFVDKDEILTRLLFKEKP